MTTLTIDEAWSLVEILLPDGWEIAVEGKNGHFVSATALNLRDATDFRHGQGETVIAALGDLATALRDRPA